MKAVILAGGLGSRLSEETVLKPKPMVTIGNMPIIWHIMKVYSAHGINDFLLCLGYKGHILKEYFSNYYLHSSNITVDLRNNLVKYHNSDAEPWTITMVDTGLHTMTGGRLRRLSKFLANDEPFCMTYGDGVGDVDISRLIQFHKSMGVEATMTVVAPPGRFGAAILENEKVVNFTEKPVEGNARINAGFFVCEPSVLSRISGDECVWEEEPLRGLSRDGQLAAFKHNGFWQPMDTLREKHMLEEFWASGNAPWKIWD